MTRRTLAAVTAPLMLVLVFVVSFASPGNPAAFLLAVGAVGAVAVAGGVEHVD